MKEKILKRVCGTIALLAGLAFIVKFGSPGILKLYVETGIGDCRKIPVFCMVPDEKIIAPGLMERGYLTELIPYNFPKMTVSVPRGFKVIQEEIKKYYYKRSGRLYGDAAIYVIYEERDFFISLFPQLRKRGINDNYEFVRRAMYAKIKDIKNISDMFFIIMKGIFIPDLGDQRNVLMRQFRMPDRRGFINYNLGNKNNYFDCNVIKDNGDFFKLYIKDEGSRLDLDWVLAIISTLDKR